MLSGAVWDSTLWRHGDRLASAAARSALIFLLLGSGIAITGQYQAAVMVVAVGAAANGALALLWSRLPRVLARPVLEPMLPWAAYGLWQGGVLLAGIGIAGGHTAFSHAAGFFLVTSAFLMLHHFGSAIYHSSRSWRDPVPLLATAMATAALSWALGATFLALWARGGGPDVVAFGLGALTFGSFTMAGGAGFLRDATAAAKTP